MNITSRPTRLMRTHGCCIEISHTHLSYPSCKYTDKHSNWPSLSCVPIMPLTWSLRSRVRLEELFRGYNVSSPRKRTGARPEDAQVPRSTLNHILARANRLTACVVTHVLQSEPTVRFILVACRLSRSLRKPKTERKLPLFDFWRSSLRRALDNDPFWGPSHSKDMEEKAAQLEVGIQQLITQCCELSQAVSTSGDRIPKSPSACFTPYHEHHDEPTIRRSSTSIPKQTIGQSHQEQVWMEKIVIGCWTTLLADGTQTIEATDTCLELPDMPSSAVPAPV